MRLFLSALVTALLVPLAAYAQAPKPVEVINPVLAVEVTTPIAIVEPVAVEIAEPLEVEVVNPAPPSPPARFQLVGFTGTRLTGDSGVLSFTSACATEFSGSRFCLSHEVVETVEVPIITDTSFAWINPSKGPNNINAPDSYCDGWIRGSGFTGATINRDGSFAFDFSFMGCDTPRPVACCALVP
jgi:hypothetical protein